MKSVAKWTIMPSRMLPTPLPSSHNSSLFYGLKILNLRNESLFCAAARRQVRYHDEDYGHNEKISKLEFYSQETKGEALLVHALVDQGEVQVLIFKGFSSSLSYGTSSDPTRGILPARAVIVSIDRIKGPFDPANIEYLQKGVTWEEFNTNLLSN